MKSVLFVFVTIYAVGNAMPCSNVLPAVLLMAHGVNLSTFDLNNPDTGLARLAAFEFTCQQNLSQEVNGVGYQVPDQFSQAYPIESIDGSVTTFASGTFANSFDFKLSLSEEMGIDAWSLFGSSSDSESLSLSYERITNTYEQFASITSTVGGFAPIYDPVFPGVLGSGPQFKAEVWQFIVNTLQPSCKTFGVDCVKQTNQFISYWGSHFLNSSCSGGVFQGFYATSKLYVSNAGSAYVQAQMENSLLVFLQSSGAYSGSVGIVDQKWLAATFIQVTTLGGLGTPTPTTYSQWAESVLQSPKVIPCVGRGTNGLQLTPFSSLMNDTGAIGNINLAVTNYYVIQFFTKEVLPQLSQFAALLPTFKPTGSVTCAQPFPTCAPMCDKEATCCTNNVGQYEQGVETITRNIAAVVSNITRLQTYVDQLLALPIVPIVNAMEVMKQYQHIVGNVQTALTTIDCEWSYVNYDRECHLFPVCASQPPETVVPSSFTYPSGFA
jgi:hypothetical protein